MIRPRSKFLTFLFSFAPGCGQMFMGFMKRGVSLLTLFFGSLAVFSLIGIEELFFFLVIIWCWAFFDSLNLMSLTPEKFEEIKDDFVLLGMGKEETSQLRVTSERVSRALGIALILVGAISIWKSVFNYVYNSFFYYDSYVAELIYRLNYYVPRLFISVLIIWIGAKLIRRKKTETMTNEEFTNDQKE